MPAAVTSLFARPYYFFLPAIGLGRTFAGARIGVGALAADRQAATMPQPPIAAEIHQPLDVHRDFPPQIAFHHIVTIDDFANLQHFLVGELGHPPRFSECPTFSMISLAFSAQCHGYIATQ